MNVLWVLFSLATSTLLGVHGYRKKSLDLSGALAGFFVGVVHFLCGPRFGVTLILFYLSSSKLTKHRAAEKAKVEEDFREGGQRTAFQVAANALGGCILALAAKLVETHNPRALDILLAAFLGHYACCCADTWSSELGILSSGKPILITTGKVVPKGTNGGVSALGTAAGGAGGLFIGLVFISTGWLDSTSGASSLSISLVPLGLMFGLIGTFLDSLLGALFQYTGFSSKLNRVVGQPGPGVVHITGRQLLSNSGVNVISANLTALLAACIVYWGKLDFPYAS